MILPDNGTLNLSGEITVAARVKISTPGLHQHLFACNDLFVLWLTEDNQYRFADTLGHGVTSTNAVPQVEKGEWHSVVTVLSAQKGDVLNPNNIKIYVDGVQLAGQYESHWAPGNLAPANACVIGGTRTGGQSHQDLPFEGVLDELLIYGRSWSAKEVRAFSLQR